MPIDKKPPLESQQKLGAQDSANSIAELDLQSAAARGKIDHAKEQMTEVHDEPLLVEKEVINPNINYGSQIRVDLDERASGLHTNEGPELTQGSAKANQQLADQALDGRGPQIGAHGEDQGPAVGVKLPPADQGAASSTPVAGDSASAGVVNSSGSPQRQASVEATRHGDPVIAEGSGHDREAQDTASEPRTSDPAPLPGDPPIGDGDPPIEDGDPTPSRGRFGFGRRS